MASAPARLAKFVKEDHRYVLLGTSAVAFVGMLLSSSPRPAMSFLANAFTVELVRYYLLVAWLVVSAVGLVLKLTHWKTYAQESPLAKPAAATALRVASYVVWACTVILFVDRAVMGFASAWAAAAAATSMPDDMLTQILYMFQQGKDTYLTGALTTIELAVFGTIIAFFLALLLAAVRILEIDRSDNDAIRFLKKVGVGFAKVYSTVVRGTPMLVQGVIVYYLGFNIVSGFGLSITEVNALWTRFIAGLVVISLNSTAYMMEVLRGGIESVEEHEVGLHAQGARDGDALLLAAREARDVGRHEVGEADLGEVLAGDVLGLRLGHLFERDGREGAVVQDVHVVEQVEALENHADLLAQLVHIDVVGGEVGAAEPHVAGVGGLEQVQAAQQGRLAGARGADDGHDLAGHDRKVDVAQDLEIAEGLAQALDADDGLGAGGRGSDCGGASGTGHGRGLGGRLVGLARDGRGDLRVLLVSHGYASAFFATGASDVLPTGSALTSRRAASLPKSHDANAVMIR